MTDPLDVLTLAVDEARAAGAAELFDALAGYFDRVEEHERGTPTPEPNFEAVAVRLYKHFPDPRAPLFLALQLVTQPDWAYWRRAGILLYLGRVADRTTLPALARVAVADADASLRDLAREALTTFEPVALSEALVAEARYWAARAAR
jgi:hypothetical protein